MALLLAASALAAELPSSITVDSNKPLNYAGDWCTTPEWMPNTCCAEGQQSPIDLRYADATHSISHEPIGVETHIVPETTMFLTSNGVELELEGEWATLTVDGVEYTAEQLHFHAVSEHVFDGFYCAGEMHVVMNSADNTKHLVLAFCLEVALHSNAFMDRMESNLIDLTPEDIQPGWRSAPQYDMSMEGLEPVFDSSYIKYTGSYTTPPCTLDVTWIVFTEQVGVSRNSMLFMSNRFTIPANHRPVQSLGGRRIDLVEVCTCPRHVTTLHYTSVGAMDVRQCPPSSRRLLFGSAPRPDDHSGLSCPPCTEEVQEGV